MIYENPQVSYSDKVTPDERETLAFLSSLTLLMLQNREFSYMIMYAKMMSCW